MRECNTLASWFFPWFKFCTDCCFLYLWHSLFLSLSRQKEGGGGKVVECADSETALEQQLSSWLWLLCDCALHSVQPCNCAAVQQLKLWPLCATHHCCENRCHPSASYLTSILVVINIIISNIIIIIIIINIIINITINDSSWTYHRAWLILQLLQIVFSTSHFGEIVHNSKLPDIFHFQTNILLFHANILIFIQI